MEKCVSYVENRWSNTLGYCMGTKEMETCSCQGNESKCNFYPEKRIKKMTTLEMMIEANKTNKTYHANDMLYNTKLGFHDKSGKKWYGYAFKYLNDLFKVDIWQEDNTVYITKSEAEKKYGIKIID